MLEFECPKCGMVLQVQDEWRGMEVSCPGCNSILIVPEAVPALKNNKKKKWLLVSVIAAAVLIAGAVTALCMSSSGSPDPLIKELFRSENPDIKQLADLIAQADNPTIYQDSFMRLFDRNLVQADMEGKYQLFEAAGALDWSSIKERRRRYNESLDASFLDAVQSMGIEEIRSLRPLMEKALPDSPLIAESIAVEQLHTLIARGDTAGLRRFAENCVYAHIKSRAENELRNMSRRQTVNLFNMAQQELSRGNPAEAEKILQELLASDPNDNRARALLAKIQSESASAVINASPGSGPNIPDSGSVPLEVRVVRACRRGMTNEVTMLMQSGADLHRTITTGTDNNRRTITVFMSLLESAGTGSPAALNIKSCLTVILQNGFSPNREERAYIREYLPELADLIK